MNFFDYIRDWFIWITNVFIDAAMWAYDIPGLGFLADTFVDMSDWSAQVSGYFYDASNWWEEVEDAIKDILSWSSIRSLIRSWLDGIEDALGWFGEWFSNVLSVIDLWWGATLQDVKDLIKVATEGFDELVEAWDTFWNITWTAFLAEFETLRDSWDTFWTVTFPTLVSFTWLETWWNSRLVEVNSLIDSTLKTWFPFYDDLVSLWEEIKTFFTSPLDWLEAKFTDWFLGKE